MHFYVILRNITNFYVFLRIPFRVSEQLSTPQSNIASPEQNCFPRATLPPQSNIASPEQISLPAIFYIKTILFFRFFLHCIFDTMTYNYFLWTRLLCGSCFYSLTQLYQIITIKKFFLIRMKITFFVCSVCSVVSKNYFFCVFCVFRGFIFCGLLWGVIKVGI